jgi:hypothetical protein
VLELELVLLWWGGAMVSGDIVERLDEVRCFSIWRGAGAGAREEAILTKGLEADVEEFCVVRNG